jgi:NAD(P)-dependent dehydrogenase (short-subunit alcohol dehydrogenase family)
VTALIFGASGGLARALADALVARGSQVDLVTRVGRRAEVEQRHGAAARVFSVEAKYSEFEAVQPYDACFFPQALFCPEPLASTDEASIAAQIEVGLTEPIRITRKLLSRHPPQSGERRDYCYVGSTSAYAGFGNTSVYCAVKHGLLGFVRAMNDEYARSDVRFRLFSMGTMNTEMGAKLKDQDPSSFLSPREVAERMVEAVCASSNMFEPEVLIRRRTIRFLEK